MGQEANQSKNTLLFTIAFALVFLLLLPLQAKATPAELKGQSNSPAAQSDLANLLHSDESGVSFELTPPEFVRTGVLTEKGEYDQIRIPGFDYTGVVGQPDLPQKGFLIALPPGAVPELNLISAESHLLPNNRVAPAAEQTLINNNYDDFTLPEYVPDFEASYPFDENVYGQDANYPANSVSLGQETTLRHQRAVWVNVNPVLYNPVQETLSIYSHLQIEVNFAFPNGRPDVETLQLETGAHAGILQASLLNYEQSINWRTRPSADSLAMPETSPCMDANAFRINVKQTGMYSISHADLSAAHNNFPAGVASNKIRMCYENQEIRIKVYDGGDGTFSSGDSLVFYGESIKTQETETNVYWLTYSTNGPNGIRMTADTDTGAGTSPAYYIPTYHLETDSRYYSVIPRSDLNDHWYWQEPIYAEPNEDTLDIPFQMSNKASGVYNFTVRVELWGFISDELHNYEVKLNGTTIGTGSFSGAGPAGNYVVYEADAPASTLQNGNNTLSIIAADTDGNPNNTGHRMLVNWVEIEPRRQFVAQNNRLAFSMGPAGTYSFAAGNFTSGATVEIFNVTDPFNASFQTKTAGGGSVAFNRTIGSTGEFELFATTAFLSPDSIAKDTIGSGTLGSGSNTADLIIITVPSFNNALTPLRNLRTSQGLTVKTVYVQDIYDEFSYGRYASYGIKDFLEYAYNNWNGDLDYVLLAGDASYDHRDVLGNNGSSNLVPVYLRSGIDSLLGEAASDNQYVDFNDDNLADMMLGRLPAQSAAELTNMIDKIIEYETGPDNPSWRGRHLFISDNAFITNPSPPPNCIVDPAGDFFATVNTFIQNFFPDNQLLSRLYYAPSNCFPNSTYPIIESYYATSLLDMQSRIIQQYNAGNQFVSYTGHSGTQSWGHETFLDTSSVSNLNNGVRTPIMLPMTCLEGWYHFNGTTNGLSEALLKRVGGGSVASYAPTGFQVQHGHDYLIEGFYTAVFVNNVQTLGEAVLAAKVNLTSAPSAYEDLHDTYMLIGDPAMRFNIPSVYQTYLPSTLK